MVIKNSTQWSTSDLRKLFRRCIKEVDKVEQPEFPFHKRNKNFKLDILNTGYNWRGRATVNGYWIMIKIPVRWANILKPEPFEIKQEVHNGKNVEVKKYGTKWSSISISDGSIPHEYYWKEVGELKELSIEHKKIIALLIIHEYYHTIGYRNQDRNNYKNDFTSEYNVDWVKDYPITKKEVVVKEKSDIKLVRYQTAILNFRKAETRLKRAKTIHNKWQKKVKYYEVVCGKS